MRNRLVLAMVLTFVLASIAHAQNCADIQVYDALTGAPASPYDTQVVSVSGVLYVTDGVFGEQVHYLVQGTSGIRFDLTTAPILVEGSEIGIDGTVTTVDGEIILSGATVAYNYGIPYVEPSLESIAAIVEPFSRVGQFVAVSGEVCARTDSTFCLSDSGDTVQVWVNANTGITLSSVANGETYRVRGACSMFNGEIRILPRRQTDLVEGSGFVRVEAGGDGSFATIAEGLDAAIGGDTVLVSCGFYNEYDLALKGGVVIRSETGDPDCVTIDAQQLGGVFDFTDVGAPEWFSLEGLTISGASGSHGALRVYIDAKNSIGTEGSKLPTPITVKKCVISNHTPTGGEGVVYALDLAPPLIFDNCVFANNNSLASLMKFENTLTLLQLVNCTLVNNVSNGSLVQVDDIGSPIVDIEKSLLAFNQAEISDTGAGAPPVFTCTNIYGNSQGDWLNDIATQADTLGNFSADPHFCDLPGGNYTLADGSLCLQGNHPGGDSCGSIGARELGACGSVPTNSDRVQLDAFGATAMRPGDSVGIRLQIVDATDQRILNESLAPYFSTLPTLGTITSIMQQPDSTWTAVYTAGLVEGADDIVGYDAESLTSPRDTLALHITNSAIITSVADIPGDQGGQVRVIWNADVRDTLGSADPIIHYVVWREVTAEAQNAGRPVLDLAEIPALWDRGKAGESGFIIRAEQSLWEPVGPAVPGMMWTQYASVVPTLSDGASSLFFVSAHTPSPQVFFTSVPAAGYSMDNLAPAVPAAVQAAHLDGTTTVDWADATEIDFQYYRVYRDGIEDFVPTPQNFAMATTVSEWPDPHGGLAVYYKVTAVDFAGNESAAGAPAFVSATDNGFLPSRNTLQGAAPNPFNPTTRITFELAAPGSARLRIYDPAGRLVAVLFDGHREAGFQSVIWDGRDSSGRMSAAGLYLYQLEAAGFVKAGRVTMVK